MPTTSCGLSLNHKALGLNTNTDWPSKLFESADGGEVEITATEVVLHEVLYILTSTSTNNGYGLTPDEACARISPLVGMPGFKHPNKRSILKALDLWAEYPRLGFSDCLTAAYAQQHQLSVASFDSDFDVLPGLIRYQPAA